MERELKDLKGAFKDETETHDKYIAALKDEYEVELRNLLTDLELATEVKIYKIMSCAVRICFWTNRRFCFLEKFSAGSGEG